MKIKDLFEKDKVVFSLEVFPPKKNGDISSIYNTLEGLKMVNPDFISVTYGASGVTASNSTVEIASIIKNKYHIESMAHLTCVNSLKSQLIGILCKLKENNIDNILALRGDKNPEIPPQTDFKYGCDLVEFLHQNGNFGVSGACYPETHLEATSAKQDILNLKTKVDMGCDTLITQVFFDNKYFYNFQEKAEIAGINVPISAGIMPITSASQIERMVTLCGASLPQKFVKMIAKYGQNKEALEEAGAAYAVNQIVDLVSNGVAGIHLYTMNNPRIAIKVYDAVKTILNK